MGYVAVVGPSEASADELADAEAVGRGLAQRGHVVLCGGHGGVMEAVARGAADAGGTVVGLLPGTDRTAANPHVTVAIPTGLGEMRNALLVRSSDVVVSVGGSWGTLSEVALAVRTGVPVVALRGWPLPGDPALHPVATVDAALEAVETLGR
ncbi:TIGR00725 family protein [Cellulomonas sp. ICMP 17802]|uniref:TIGR00725 family protein n=1 Tax=Cellulomonas sp. ICMP 17802 TaxID=3239199 RepID=UPI00351BB664